ncbi:hypothetical protein H1S01_15825 [Heliobacterium chlorum]|uniref:Lipoprotein n=1 Tax=Heliobacterium chlorum TaxID=2698 RepID=A0ABR7T597_HELCL|nr:hypothetical protein [Heliobacterium chlorum]MBC9785954.1 hypothetical protein [Heliobacterium chlorum]
MIVIKKHTFRRYFAISGIFITLSFLNIAGCSSLPPKNEVSSDISAEVDKITIEITNVTTLPEGTSYSLRLTNGSSHVIKQNVVYVSYLIKISNGRTMNNAKIEASDNKLNIKPNDVVPLTAFIPKEYYENNPFLDSETPYFEIKGYLHEVTEMNQFGHSGPLNKPISNQ